jgi:hypothetical protein
VIREEIAMDLSTEDVVEKKKPGLETLRMRLERVLELVQVDRAGAASEVVAEMVALERAAIGQDLGRFVDGASAAAGLGRRWQKGTLSPDDARIAVLRLTLAMIRELAVREGGRR